MPHPSKRILVVDDERDIRVLLMRIFEEAGYEVDTADTGPAALERLEAYHYDLLTLDLVMPGMDGWGVIEQMQQAPSPPPVVVLSGGESPHQPLIRESVAAFVAKPFRIDALLQTCRQVLASAALSRTEKAFVERRKEPRRRLLLDATVLSSEGTPVALGRLVDVSAGGAKMDLGAPLEPGSSVRISFNIPGGKSVITLQGRIQWQKSPMLGISFVNMGPEEERRLQEIVNPSE